MPVAVYQNATDNEFYACDGNDTDKLNFVGFAISNGVDTGSIDIQFEGIVKGFSGLTEGSLYYVQDDKTIGTSKGTYGVLVGRAISATELLIIKATELQYTNGTTTKDLSDASGTQNIAHGLGKKPKKIKLNILRGLSGNGANIILASYNGTTSSVIGRDYINGADRITNGSTIVAYGGANETEYQTGTITFDATNIIITWVKTSNPTGTIQIMWEAEI